VRSRPRQKWALPSIEIRVERARRSAAGKKKILGLNAAKLYGIEVPAGYRLDAGQGTPAARDDAQLVSGA